VLSIALVTYSRSPLELEGIARRHRGFIVVSDVSRLFNPTIAAPATSEDDDVSWATLLGLGTPRRFDAGYSLFQQNDPAEDVYLLAGGYVDLSVSSGSRASDTPKSLWWSYAGELLGDGAALLGRTEPATATTRTRCFLHQVPARVFREALGADRDPAMFDLLLAQSEELHAATLDAAAVRQPVRNGLEHVLGRLAAQHGGHAAADVQLTDYSPNNATLAGYTGTEERYVSHLLRQLKAENVAWRGAGRVITVRDMARGGASGDHLTRRAS
jgi:CRP-like cAMP-binding protein